MHKEDKKQKKARTKLLLGLADAVLVTVLIGAVAGLIVTLRNYHRDRVTYEEATDLYVAIPAPSPTPELILSESWEPPREKPPLEVDFATLQAEAPHVRAWIYSAETPINYPVMYYTNNEYYLTHSYDGSRAKGGALFFDSRNEKTLDDTNLIIYGHHMKNDTMFGSLMEYQSEDYYREHPRLYLLTPEQDYRIEVFAAWGSNSNGENFPTRFLSDASRRQFYNDAVARSSFGDTSDYRADAKMISLVTCSYDTHYDDARFQVNGWLVPIG